MEKDHDLKVEMSNILWSLGAYTRLNVKLAQYESQRAGLLELTDLDVLGIRTSPELTLDFIVADCTSRRSILESPIQRVFWLRGVMDFFGASRGYLRLGSGSRVPEVQRAVAGRLGVSVLNDVNFANLRNRVLNSGIEQLKLASPESWAYLEGNLKALPSELSRLQDLRKYAYWLVPAHERLHLVISSVGHAVQSLAKAGKFGKALVVDLIALYTLAILQMSSFVSRVNPENAESELRSYFYGGYGEMKRREAILKDMLRLLEKVPGQSPLFGEAFRLDPDYLPRLFDLAFRIMNKPLDSAQIPRYLQMILFERVLYDASNSVGSEYLSRHFSDLTKKLARDVADFFCDATSLPKSLAEDV